MRFCIYVLRMRAVDILLSYNMSRLAPSLPLDSSEVGLFSNGFLRSGLGTEKRAELSARAEKREKRFSARA